MSKDEYRGYRHPFIVATHYLRGVGDSPRNVVELAMCQFSAKIRREKEWWNHFQTPAFREKWKQFGIQHSWEIFTPSSSIEKVLTAKQVEYVLDELVGYAALCDEALGLQMSCFERIWESNRGLNADALAALNNNLACLRESRYNHTTDDVTLNVIDPYLHCLVYHRTFVNNLSEAEYPQQIPSPRPDDVYSTSPRFAFLPTDVSLSTCGAAKFLSYINNLHPSNTSIYAQLEAALTGLVPLFERVLTDLHRTNPLFVRIKGGSHYTEWEEPESPEDSDDDEGWARYEREITIWSMHRPIQLPDVPSGGYPGGFEHRNYKVSLRGRQLQVVIEYRETRLKPDGRQYLGTPWHVEGMKNERIVACVFYYISVDNITDNSIQFRMAVTAPQDFVAGDNGATLRTWGFADGDACHQYVGDVPIQAGLAVAFPNICQHRETSFRLKDPSREGHQNVLVFLLVDPEIQPIVSTSAVAPQQREWIMRALDQFLDPRLPNEIIERIVENVASILTDEEAEGFRRKMIHERSNFWTLHDNYYFCLPFNVWGSM